MSELIISNIIIAISTLSASIFGGLSMTSNQVDNLLKNNRYIGIIND